jgi:hypothetical protein
MESNGESNKIHVSQMTADLIQQAGKGYVFVAMRFFSRVRILLTYIFLDAFLNNIDNRHWLTMRSDQVMAKGKGLMQTYWCDPLLVRTDSDRKSRHSSIASSEKGSDICWEI